MKLVMFDLFGGVQNHIQCNQKKEKTNTGTCCRCHDSPQSVAAFGSKSGEHRAFQREKRNRCRGKACDRYRGKQGALIFSVFDQCDDRHCESTKGVGGDSNRCDGMVRKASVLSGDISYDHSESEIHC